MSFIKKQFCLELYSLSLKTMWRGGVMGLYSIYQWSKCIKVGRPYEIFLFHIVAVVSVTVGVSVTSVFIMSLSSGGCHWCSYCCQLDVILLMLVWMSFTTSSSMLFLFLFRVNIQTIAMARICIHHGWLAPVTDHISAVVDVMLSVSHDSFSFYLLVMTSYSACELFRRNFLVSSLPT